MELGVGTHSETEDHNIWCELHVYIGQESHTHGLSIKLPKQDLNKNNSKWHAITDEGKSYPAPTIEEEM